MHSWVTWIGSSLLLCQKPSVHQSRSVIQRNSHTYCVCPASNIKLTSSTIVCGKMKLLFSFLNSISVNGLFLKPDSSVVTFLINFSMNAGLNSLWFWGTSGPSTDSRNSQNSGSANSNFLRNCRSSLFSKSMYPFLPSLFGYSVHELGHMPTHWRDMRFCLQQMTRSWIPETVPDFFWETQKVLYKNWHPPRVMGAIESKEHGSKMLESWYEK